MIAVTILALGGLSLQLALGIAVGIAIGVLVAQLAAPKVKRFAAAALIALALVPEIAAVTRASEGETGVVIVDECKRYTPSDPEWWLLGCFWP